jgi:PPOX class probable F420-dependent enzyme
MASTLPPALRRQNYINVTTFRKSGVAVTTPLWFAEDNGRLYVMTRSDSGKYKRIRNNPEVKIAPATIRGRTTGAEFPARARILPPEEWEPARKVLRAKYWLTRIPFLWSKKNVYLEITL